MKNNKTIWVVLLLFSLFVACKKKPAPQKKEIDYTYNAKEETLCSIDYHFPNCRLSKAQIEKEKALEPFCPNKLNGLDEDCQKIVEEQDSIFRKELRIYEKKYNKKTSPLFKKGVILISRRALYKYVLLLRRTLNKLERYIIANSGTAYIKNETTLGENYTVKQRLLMGSDSACFYIKQGRIAYSRDACFRNRKVDYISFRLTDIEIDSTKDYLYKEWELVELYPSKK